MRILVSDKLEDEALEQLRKFHSVDYEELSYDDLLKRIGEYDALIVRSRTKVTKEVLERGKRLKVVGRAGVGVDNIDVDAATERKVVVVNAPTGSTLSVAELTIGHMLSLARRIPQADRSVKEGKWEKKRFEGTELHGKVLGLVGSGRIGAEVARLATAFGMKVIAYDPYLTERQAAERGVRLTSLKEVLSTSDFVSIHAALTPETKGMISWNEFNMMKRSSYIINCARGEIIDEKALYSALKEGRIAGAGLDVFAEEPPKGTPLLSLENVVLTPHLGASTLEGQKRTGMIVVEQVHKALSGQVPEFLVNPKALRA